MSDLNSDDMPVVDACAHYWMLSAPARGGTRGVCKHCGAHREFSEADGRPAWTMRRGKRTPPSV